MKQTVVGLFKNASDAQQAAQHLLSSGFTNDNVDVSLSTYQNSSSSNSTDFNLDGDRDEHESGISRFFKNLFSDNDGKDADKYSSAASRGRSVVTVHAQSEEEASRAADLLDENGAIDVDEDASETNTYSNSGAAPVGAFNETTGTGISAGPGADFTSPYGTTGMSADMATGTGSRLGDSDVTNKSIPIIEENLEVGKRTVQTGGVRLRSRIVERPVEEELRLRKERVYVERNAVNRAASESDFNTFKEGELEVTEEAEVPVVSKQARVVEEVSLGKDVDERTETVRDTVRKTEVDVEDLTNRSTSTDTTWKDNS